MNYNATSIRRRTSLLIIALGDFAMSFGQSKSLLAGTEVGAQLKSAAVKENTWAYGKDPAKEDVSKRDFNSKHFKNDDGTYTGVFSAGIIHYEDGGKYYDIDANIQPNLLGNHAAYSYVNSTNLMKSYFANHSSGGLLSVSTEGEVKEFLNTRFYWEKNGTAFNSISSTDVASTVDGNKITYKNLYPAVDAQYTLSAGRRELNYIINDASILSSVPSGADYMVFAEDIQIDANWSYELSQEGTVILKDISGRMVYEYESPVVGDGFGAANYRPLLADNNIADIQAQRNGNTLRS
ncbi:MAG: hypothetical protein IPP77_09310 [Bacteroidetes bacterium]|nr:hypothetical protein [Bacteroidota bacterium]